MTVSTLTAAARTADSAVEHEHKILAQICVDERAAQDRLTGIQSEIARLRSLEHEVAGHVAGFGRARAAQEQHVQVVAQAMADHAQAIVRMMGELDMRAPEPEQPQQPGETRPDELGVGEVEPTAKESAYIQQAGEQGAPPNMTQPVPALRVQQDGGEKP